MEIEQKKFDRVKTESEAYYKTIGDVHCPYLKGNVSFNSKGLEHLKFKERNKARLLLDQYIRLKLLKTAPHILNNSHTVQEFFETNKFEQQKINSRWEYRSVKVTYYGFVAIISGARIKVIVKEVAGGNKFFWSLIPFWKNKVKNGQNKKILHAGDLEAD